MTSRGSVPVRAVCVALAATLGAAAPAVADEPYAVPNTATIHVEGDGSGHGKGLSQYGAYGAARAPHNLTADEILNFYYPNTRDGDVGGRIAIWISRDDDRSLIVDARRGLTVHGLKGGGTWRLREPGATRWRLKPDGGKTVVAYRTKRWHTWRTVRGDAEVSAGGKPVTLRTPDGAVSYRGVLRSTHHDDERLTVNVLPLDQYVRGVVPAEVSSIWPQQAMRAQAVASRTYAAYEREHAGSRAYDLCDTAACQAYGGASAETDKSDAAVAGTARRILTYQGETAFAQYSASNGGWTVDGGRPYLQAQADPYEGTSSDFYGWNVDVTSEDIEDRYNIENLTGIRIESRDGRGPRGGRVGSVWLQSSTGWTDTVTGESFRRNFGLPSTLFEITAVD